MLNDLGHKIKRSKERLLLTQMEQAAANGRIFFIFLYSKFNFFKNCCPYGLTPVFLSSWFMAVSADP
jgi:hypothetical protein